MMKYEDYDKAEIKAIADKFGKEFVSIEELKTWYAFKNALKSRMSDCKSYLKMAEKNREDDDPLSEITLEVKKEFQALQDELSWMRSITTFPLEDFCKYYELDWDYNQSEDDPRITMAQRVIDGVSDDEAQLIREFIEESDMINSLNNYRHITTPVSLRRWAFMKRNATEYCPYISSEDATMLYNGKPHYVYVHSECDCHRWGDSYWISVDCDNTLYSLPVIKAFKEYEFKIGKFYKITCTDTIRWGNKKKYVMEIEESDEETFMKEGLRQYARRWY